MDNFNAMQEHEKVKLIFDANKIAEKIDADSNYQLFRIENFYVETKTSVNGMFKRSIKTYSLKELPVEYAGQLLSIPIVVLNSEVSEKSKAETNNEKIMLKR